MFQSILLDSTSGTLKEWFQNLWNDTGFVVDYSRFEGYSLGIWGCLIMLVVACFLVYLAVVKKFEPMLLVGIAFGVSYQYSGRVRRFDGEPCKRTTRRTFLVSL